MDDTAIANVEANAVDGLSAELLKRDNPAGRHGAATGGETGKNGGNIANAVYPAELWTPQTETWTTMPSIAPFV